MNEFLIAGLTEEIKTLNERMSKMNKEVFNTDEAAEYLTISKDVLLRLARINKIEYVKNGRNYIFKKEYLDKWLDKNKVRVI